VDANILYAGKIDELILCRLKTTLMRTKITRTQRGSNLVSQDRLESLSGSNPSLLHKILTTRPSAEHTAQHVIRLITTQPQYVVQSSPQSATSTIAPRIQAVALLTAAMMTPLRKEETCRPLAAVSQKGAKISQGRPNVATGFWWYVIFISDYFTNLLPSYKGCCCSFGQGSSLLGPIR